MRDSSMDTCLRTTRSSTVRSARVSSARRPSSAISRLAETRTSHEESVTRAIPNDDVPAILTTQTINVYLRIKPRLTKSKRIKKIQDDTYVVASPSCLQTKFPCLENVAAANCCSKKTKSPKEKIKETVTNRKFAFTKIFGPESTQMEIFEETTKRRVADFLAGQSITLMTYGTTNSGKTYTLQGNHESPGIIPRSIEYVFSGINCTLAPWYKPVNVREVIALSETARAQAIETRENLLSARSAEKCVHEEIYGTLENSMKEDRECGKNGEAMYSVWLSYVEIYNDGINDLLVSDETRPKISSLKLQADRQGRPFVQGCRMICATTGLEAFRLLMAGRSRLTIASTDLNPQSSRSHSIFTITLLKYSKERAPEDVEVSTMTFCDLAGTGKSRKSSSTGNELQETKNINTSLLVLGRCLKGVADSQNSRHSTEIVGPFRESKLTRLFQRCIAGKENLCFLINIDTSPSLYVETQAVLAFASLAKKIVVEIGKDPRQSCIGDLTISSPKDSPIRERERPSTVAHIDTTTDKRRVQAKAEVEQLKEVNVTLSKEIAMLRETALNREYEIRQEMATLYTNIVKDLEANWQKRTKDVEEEQDSLLKWSVKQIETFYKERIDSLNSRKRRRTSGGDQLHDDGKELCEQLESENSRITAKVVALRKSVKKLQEEQEVLSADKDKCVFELSLAKDVLKRIRQLLDEESTDRVVTNDSDDVSGLVSDLRSFIDDKNETIASLKKSLELAKGDKNVQARDSEDTSDLRRSIGSQTLDESIGIEEKDIDAKISSSTFKKESNHVFLPSSTRYSIAETENSIADEETVADSSISSRYSSLPKNESMCHLHISFMETIDNVFCTNVETSSKNDSGIAIGNATSSSTENSLSNASEEKSSQTKIEDDGKSAKTNEIIHERVEQLKNDYTKLKAEHLRDTLRVTDLSKELESIQISLSSLKESTRQNELKIIDYQEKLLSREKDLSSLGHSKFQMEKQLYEVSKKLETRSIAYEEKILELRDELKFRESNENRVVVNLEECQEKTSILENQLTVAHVQIDKNSIKCFTEHVPRIEQLEKELATKCQRNRELKETLSILETDLKRVNELNERVVRFGKICDEQKYERDELARQLHERTEAQNSLEHRIKRLASKVQERDNEISSLRMDLSNVVKMNMENSERARDLSREIAVAHDKLANVREEITRSEEERRKLERTSGHEIGNLIARLADFEKNATILARMRENEDSRIDQLDSLKLLLHEKEREMCLFKKNRDKTIRRYETLIRKLQADVELRCNRETSKLRMLYPKRSMSRGSLGSVTESLRWKTTLRQSVEKVRSTQGVMDRRKCRKCQSTDYTERKCSRSYPACSSVAKDSSSRVLAASSTSLEDSPSSASKNCHFRYEDDDDDESGGHEIIETESRTELNLELLECRGCGRRDELSQAAPTFSIPSTSDESFTDFCDLPKWMKIRRTNGRIHCRLRKADPDVASADKPRT